MYGSANHDPEQFKNPDEFIIYRSPNRYIAFGGGVHFCLGNSLARLNMSIIFTSLLKRLKNIELAVPEPEFKIGLSSRGLKSLPISFKAA